MKSDGKYKSIKEKCEAYGISTVTYNKRIKAGWSEEDALIRPPQRDLYGPNGKKYKNADEMCADYGVKKSTYMARRYKYGFDKQRALLPDNLRNREITFHGVHYDSLKELAGAYDVPYITLTTRLSRGWNLERAVKEPVAARKKKNKTWRVEDEIYH